MVKGYKAFNKDWTCRGFQYEVGKEYEMDELPILCDRGFHFCTKLRDCVEFYPYATSNKYAEVVALGEVDGEVDFEYHSKCCTNHLKVVREIPYEEAMRILNSGVPNQGVDNTGRSNFGDENTGDNNRGMRNTGSYNQGDRNTGNDNRGDRNAGYNNTGFGNTGHDNYGDINSGDGNVGSYNSGDRNVGNHNSGDWNCCDNGGGCFNTKSQPFMLFNSPANWTREDWEESEAKCILFSVPNKRSERQAWWNTLDNHRKKVIMAIPNFDSRIFKEVTGIQVTVKDVLKMF